MHKEQRGLRFPFSAAPEVLVESSGTGIPARVTELSLRGCLLEVFGSFAQEQQLFLKMFHSDEYFEAPTRVIYVTPSGVGVLFNEVNPHFRDVLQKWILAALVSQGESKHA
jgi:hypothetical protein